MQPLTSLVFGIVVVAGLSLSNAGCHSTENAAKVPPLSQQSAAPPRIQLRDTTPSIDALVDRFLTALEAKDFAALERLRVTKDEYLTFILPGSVEPGQLPKRYPADPADYYWGMLNTKSIYTLRSTVASYGGKHYRRKDMRFGKGTQAYAWYKAYKKLHLIVEDDEGQELEIDTGSIAEVNGQFKFISFRAG